ncbi:MAG: AAA family ATPase [Acholeplasmataceae bacterium]|jgi:AAA15 family ATPase/GTPase
MIFYEVNLDGLYNFKNFSIDFVFSRESIYSPIFQRHKKYPNLKYKKFAILLGANASGKTTFGKALCFIQNFLFGKDLSKTSLFDLFGAFEVSRNNKISFGSTFSTDDHMYKFKIVLDENGIFSETWQRIKLKNISYTKHKEELEGSKTIFSLSNIQVPGFNSLFLNNPNYISYRDEITKSLGFVYNFSEDRVFIDEKIGLDTALFEKIVKSFDNSIVSVTDSIDVEGNKIIRFKSGHKEIVLADGTLANGANSILSSGTKESILLSHLLYAIYMGYYHTIYIDEKLTHTHTEIEQQIIQIFISLIDRVDGQVFITSHNSDLLDLEIPNYNFILFKKNKDGSITEVIEPEKFFKHQNRSLRRIVDEDVFSTSPILDNLIQLHDDLIG